MNLPERMVRWATDSLAGLLEALVPANAVAACEICERPTPSGVQPCTECYYGAALMRPVELTEMDRQRIMQRAGERLGEQLTGAPVPGPVDHVDQIGDLMAQFITSSANAAAQTCPTPQGHDDEEVGGTDREPLASSLETGHDMGLSHAAEFFPQHRKK